MPEAVPKKYTNGRMTHAYMKWHLRNNQGAILINNKPVTKLEDLPPPEKWADEEEKEALASELELKIRALQTERDALLKQNESLVQSQPQKRGRRKFEGEPLVDEQIPATSEV